MANCAHRITDAGEFNKLVKIDFTQTAPNCSEFVIFWADEGAELLALLSESSISLQDVFAIPESAALSEAFQTSFSLVLIVWLSAWAYGVVVNYFNPEHER